MISLNWLIEVQLACWKGQLIDYVYIVVYDDLDKCIHCIVYIV